MYSLHYDKPDFSLMIIRYLTSIIMHKFFSFSDKVIFFVQLRVQKPNKAYLPPGSV